eukprot:gene6522-13185_t
MNHSYPSDDKTTIQKLLIHRFPELPMKSHTSQEGRRMSAKTENENQTKWFYIKSPREIHGVIGPKSTKDLRTALKSGAIKENTLIWAHGLENWQKLKSTPELWNHVFELPPIPFKEEMQLNPINKPSGLESFIGPGLTSRMPTKLLTDTFRWNSDWSCSVCGNHAVHYTKGTGDFMPCLEGIRSPAGSTENATEIIPNFLWIGNASTGRSRTLEGMRITLAINCSHDMRTLDSKIPMYRCKEIPLHEDPKSEEVNHETYFRYFEDCFTWIELQRTAFELTEAGEVKTPLYAGPTDSLGDPIQKPGDKNDNRKAPLRKWPTPRILLYSRLGLDRPCMLVAAYFIRRWGISADLAIEIVANERIGTNMCSSHVRILQEWARKHSLGALYCDDCVLSVRSKNKPSLTHTASLTGVVDADIIEREIQREIHPDISNFAAVITEDHPLYILGNPEDYIQNVLIGDGRVAVEEESREKTSHSRPNNMFNNNISSHNLSKQIQLFDLCLGGQKLDDAITEILFDALVNANIIQRLRSIRLPHNTIGCRGVAAMVKALLGSDDGEDDVSFEIVWMDLSHNRIGAGGARYLSILLCHCQSIISLDLTDNILGDGGSAAIILMTKDLSRRSMRAYYISSAMPCNQSLTDLRLGLNELGAEASDALLTALKANSTLTTLHLDFNVSLKAKEIKEITSSLRAFNTTIQQLSFADIPISVNSAHQIFQILSHPEMPLRSLNLARCGLLAKHLQRLPEQIRSVCHLTELDISGNTLGDEGIEKVARIIYGVEGLNDAYYRAPLIKLDVNGCGITKTGAHCLLRAVSSSPTITYLDLSDNTIGREIQDLSQEIVSCKFKELLLNRCKLGTRGACFIFDSLIPLNDVCCGNFIQRLSMAENEVQDEVSTGLRQFLQQNHTIQYIDLGFNALTNRIKDEVFNILEVTPKSNIDSKVNELSINLLGNKCDQFALEMPCHARSKTTLRYLPPNAMVPDLGTGISVNAIESYRMQKMAANKAHMLSPSIQINRIS